MNFLVDAQLPPALANWALLAWLQPLWPDVVSRLEQGEKLIELRT